MHHPVRTLELSMGGRLTPSPDRFTSTKEPLYPLHRRQGGPQCRSGRMQRIENLLSSLGFDLRTVVNVISTNISSSSVYYPETVLANNTAECCLKTFPSLSLKSRLIPSVPRYPKRLISHWYHHKPCPCPQSRPIVIWLEWTLDFELSPCSECCMLSSV
jgi:hypothetical protein